MIPISKLAAQNVQNAEKTKNKHVSKRNENRMQTCFFHRLILINNRRRETEEEKESPKCLCVCVLKHETLGGSGGSVGIFVYSLCILSIIDQGCVWLDLWSLSWMICMRYDLNRGIVCAVKPIDKCRWPSYTDRWKHKKKSHHCSGPKRKCDLINIPLSSSSSDLCLLFKSFHKISIRNEIDKWISIWFHNGKVGNKL